MLGNRTLHKELEESGHLNPPALLRENELNRMTGFVVARESSYSSNDAGRESSYTSNSNLKSGYNIL